MEPLCNRQYPASGIGKLVTIDRLAAELRGGKAKCGTSYGSDKSSTVLNGPLPSLATIVSTAAAFLLASLRFAKLILRGAKRGRRLGL